MNTYLKKKKKRERNVLSLGNSKEFSKREARILYLIEKDGLKEVRFFSMSNIYILEEGKKPTKPKITSTTPFILSRRMTMV